MAAAAVGRANAVARARATAFARPTAAAAMARAPRPPRPLCLRRRRRPTHARARPTERTNAPARDDRDAMSVVARRVLAVARVGPDAVERVGARGDAFGF